MEIEKVKENVFPISVQPPNYFLEYFTTYT